MLGIASHHGLLMDGPGMAMNYMQQAMAQLSSQFGGGQHNYQFPQQPKCINNNNVISAGGAGKKSKLDYSNSFCAICNAPADGLHYGAISCRSCNAFFRRAVTFKQTFLCRKGGNCDVDVSVRCACRACRLNKCKAAGMRESDVQPKRDPTGSQKNRRAPQRRRGTNGLLVVKKETDSFESNPGTILPSVESSQCSEKGLLTCIAPTEDNPYRTMLSPTTASFPPSAESGIFEEPSSGGGIVFLKTIKKEESEYLDEADDYDEEADADEAPSSSVQMRAADELASTPNDPQQSEFDALVRDYREHLLCMNRSMTSIENFLSEESGSCSKWRVMEPTDVEQLSKVELGGLMYWIEKLWPFRRLKPKERETLFKRYSMRKLSLDHFYTASKYPELLAGKNFAMLNNTYVPPDRTGFETVTDDKHTREAKFQILRPTLDRLWESIVLPFAGMRITDEEIVALHLMLMWSPSNNRLVGENTRQLMAARRDWTIQRLHRHYQLNGCPSDPSVRLGEVLLLLPELEVICDLHCKDFQVAQLFEFCNMSDYWYEAYCYTPLNIAT